MRRAPTKPSPSLGHPGSRKVTQRASPTSTFAGASPRCSPCSGPRRASCEPCGGAVHQRRAAPWLEQELAAILATTPPAPNNTEPRPGCGWADWDWHLEPEGRPAGRPPLQLLVILDNLKGHHTPTFVQWCAERGILLLYTPIAGSWLNLAESLQRIVVRRALAGQHPESASQVMDWLAAQVRGWNAHPTPFVWGGKRAARRQRAYERRHALGGAAGYTRRPIPRRQRLVR